VNCHEGWRYPEMVRRAVRDGAPVVFHPHFHQAEPGSYRPSICAVHDQFRGCSVLLEVRGIRSQRTFSDPPLHIEELEVTVRTIAPMRLTRVRAN
jgi:hypothetical protein